ncbi:MAG: hypothetical protein M3Q06_08235 [Bacteroidota bacterium]|nr:hypothetical protein [Bacteroidota bacterium]
MALTSNLARLTSTTTKTVPQWRGTTPRWLLKLLPYIQVKAGVYRVNRVMADPSVVGGHSEGDLVPDSYAGLEDDPLEYTLSPVEAGLRIHSRVMDLYTDPYDQLQLQAMVLIEAMREQQEYEVINHPEIGLLAAVSENMTLGTESGPPTPNDMDNLIGLVWNRPAFFLAHPRTIARFGHECTKRGVCIGAVEMLGSPFQTWRGIPIVPSNKMPIDGDGNSHIVLMRVGAEHLGVVGLQHTQVKNEVVPGISMRLTGIDSSNIATYMLTLYHSVAVHTAEALGVMTVKI